MNALILAGGRGTRLWPLTKETPKSLLPIMGKPIICHQIELLRENGLGDIIMSVGYLGEKIMDYLGDGSRFRVRVRYAREMEPLGTGGGLKNCEKLVEDDSVLIIYSDIFTRMNLKKLVDFHEKQDGIASIVVHKTDHPQDSDLIKLDENSLIRRIFRRPHEEGHLTSEISKSSIYIFNKRVFDYIPRTKNSFEDEVLPLLVQKERVYGYFTREPIRDIGTAERYRSMGDSQGRLVPS